MNIRRRVLENRLIVTPIEVQWITPTTDTIYSVNSNVKWDVD